MNESAQLNAMAAPTHPASERCREGSSERAGPPARIDAGGTSRARPARCCGGCRKPHEDLFYDHNRGGASARRAPTDRSTEDGPSHVFSLCLFLYSITRSE